MRRVELSTGVALNVAFAGARDSPPVVLLHGFPESHRCWREVAPRLADLFYLIMPDQRGYGESDRPQGVDAYRTKALVADVFALADALGLEEFALAGHDWGGAVAWAAALSGDKRLAKLAIVNSPHPAIFQKSLIEDEHQRLASQYVNAFRAEGIEAFIEKEGFDWFFERTFGGHVDLALISESEKRRYIENWSRPGALTAMLNWYRASPMIVPPPGVSVPVPDAVLGFSAKVAIPTLVLWGMLDTALLPMQLDGLDKLVDDLTVVRLPGAGHFAPWQAADEVAGALGRFLG